MEVGPVFLLLCSILVPKILAAELHTISDSLFLSENDSLVSDTGIFELGYFRPDSSANRYLGIRYRKITITTLVWVANRDQPLARASASSQHVLKVSDQGLILVLISNSSSSSQLQLIWSSNSTTESRNATAKLLDSGNLVLMDQHMKVVWQSFDYPTEHWLPGMKLGTDYLRGIQWHLSSWTTSGFAENPVVGEFTWCADIGIHGYPECKLRQGSTVIYRLGLWRNQRFNGVSSFTRDVVFIDNITMNQLGEVSDAYSLRNSSILSRVTLSSSGKLESWVWVDRDQKWQVSMSYPKDICDTYNICNAYGSCVFNMVQQSCVCLDERFVPRNKKDWEMRDWSGGCVRRTPLDSDCRNGSDVFIKYPNVKLPEANGTWYNMSMTTRECEAKCLNNCTCTAYANPDPSLGETGCVLWFGDLIDIRVYPEGSDGRDIFVKMTSLELAVTQSDSMGANIKIIVPVIVAGVLMGCISSWLWYTRKRVSLNMSKSEEQDMELPLFSFSTVAKATANFSLDNKLGEGGFGPVYKGVLEEGQQIAVKRLSRNSNQGLDELKNELICISKLQHRNLVKVLGCCIQGDEKLLIYEYMPNKSLDSFIFDKTESTFLDWTTRFNIIKGIARGLLYLHQDSRLRIIHRDLKASNILLDQDMIPKISDFGIARSFGGNESQANTERVVGTYGYMPPEYALDGTFSVKSDVYSFGVLVLEIVSGRRNRGVTEQHGNSLMGYAWRLYNEGMLTDIIDATLGQSCHPTEIVRSIQVGLLCVQQNAGDRPNMSSVIMMLDGERALPQPKQPAYFMESELIVCSFSSNVDVTSSTNGLTITEVDAR